MPPRISTPQNTLRERFFRRWRSFGRQNLNEIFTTVLPVAVVDRDDPDDVENLWGRTLVGGSAAGVGAALFGFIIVAPADRVVYLVDASVFFGDVNLATYPGGLAALEATAISIGGDGVWNTHTHVGAHVMMWTPLAGHVLTGHGATLAFELANQVPDALNLNEGSLTSPTVFAPINMSGFPTHSVNPNVAYLGEVRKLRTDPPSGSAANVRDVGYSTQFVTRSDPPLRIPPGRVLAFLNMEFGWTFNLSVRFYERTS